MNVAIKSENIPNSNSLPSIHDHYLSLKNFLPTYVCIVNLYNNHLPGYEPQRNHKSFNFPIPKTSPMSFI